MMAQRLATWVDLETGVAGCMAFVEVSVRLALYPGHLGVMRPDSGDLGWAVRSFGVVGCCGVVGLVDVGMGVEEESVQIDIVAKTGISSYCVAETYFCGYRRRRSRERAGRRRGWLILLVSPGLISSLNYLRDCEMC